MSAGLEIRVLVEPYGEGIITGFPDPIEIAVIKGKQMHEYEKRRERLDGRLRAIMNAVPGLSKFDRDNIESLMGGDEYGIAVEVLCSQLYEYDHPITERIFQEISVVASETGTLGEVAILRSNIHP